MTPAGEGAGRHGPGQYALGGVVPELFASMALESVVAVIGTEAAFSTNDERVAYAEEVVGGDNVGAPRNFSWGLWFEGLGGFRGCRRR